LLNRCEGNFYRLILEDTQLTTAVNGRTNLTIVYRVWQCRSDSNGHKGDNQESSNTKPQLKSSRQPHYTFQSTTLVFQDSRVSARSRTFGYIASEILNAFSVTEFKRKIKYPFNLT